MVSLEHVLNALSQPLPGWEAQMLMTPDPFRVQSPPQHKEESCRLSSVMILLLADSLSDEPKLTLTVRSFQLSHHAGQVSLPGGGIDEGETKEMAALREAREEIGVAEHDIRVVGKLSHLYIPVSNNLMFPIVGVTSSDTTFYPDPREVHEVFTVPVSQLLKEDVVEHRPWSFRGKESSYPYWNLHNDIPVWGATAMILSEFAEVIKNQLGKS